MSSLIADLLDRLDTERRYGFEERAGTIEFDSRVQMGVQHGAFCLGCCWFLMLLLFFGGVMNLYWIVGLAIFVLLEKTTRIGHWLTRVSGVGLLVGAAWLATQAA